MRHFKAALILAAFISGCGSTPYISVKHFSDPSIKDDGYDVGCVGAKTKTRFSYKLGVCQNIRGGTLLDLEVMYDIIL